MTEPTRKPQPRAKTRVKNLGGIKASLVAVSMALTVGGWAVLARDDSLVLSQTAPQAGVEQSAPSPMPTAPPPPTTAPVPFQPNRRNEDTRRPTVQAQQREQEDEQEDDERAPRTAPTPIPTQPPAPQPTQPLPTQPPAQIPPTVAPQQRTQPSAPSTAPRVSPPVQAPQPRARTRSSK